MSVTNQDIVGIEKQVRDIDNAVILTEIDLFQLRGTRSKPLDSKPLLVARNGRFSLISKKDCLLVRLFKRMLLFVGYYSSNQELLYPLREAASAHLNLALVPGLDKQRLKSLLQNSR